MYRTQSSHSNVSPEALNPFFNKLVKVLVPNIFLVSSSSDRKRIRIYDDFV